MSTEEELSRLSLLQTLEETAGAWCGEDHPEFRQGVEVWVRELREQDLSRDERVGLCRLSS